MVTVQNTNKAIKSHASTGKEYGGASVDKYGHVILSNEYTKPIGGAIESVGASQHCVYNAYNNILSQTPKVRFSGIIDASAGNVTKNVALDSDDLYILCANKGTSENEIGVYILCRRNSQVVWIILKSLPSGITISRSGTTVGVTFESGIVGILSVVKLAT